MTVLRVDVRTDIKQLERQLRDIERKKLPKAIARALTKTAQNVRVEASREIRKVRPLKASTVKQAMSVQRATPSNLVSSVTASGKPIPAREYKATQTKRGVKVTVTKGNRKFIGPQGRRGFMVDKFGRHVFQRVGVNRLPIKKIFGPSIPGTFLRKNILAAMRKVIGTNFPKRLAEEVRFALRR